MVRTYEAPISRESAPWGAHQQVYDLLRARVLSGRVLDIPCGSGAFTKRLVEGGYEVTAADLEAHAAVPQAQFRQTDMNQPLPFEDGAFDAVVSIEGIEHIEGPFGFIRECRRVLGPGGWLILSTPNISSLRSRWRWFLTGFHNKAKYPLDEQNPAPRHHINMLSFPELRYLLHTNGFAIEKATTNRVKAISRLYAPFAAVQVLVSKWEFRGAAKNDAHRRQIREIARQMRSGPILFGETLIVAARAEG